MQHVLQNVVDWNIEMRDRAQAESRAARERGNHERANGFARDARRYTSNILELNRRLATDA